MSRPTDEQMRLVFDKTYALLRAQTYAPMRYACAGRQLCAEKRYSVLQALHSRIFYIKTQKIKSPVHSSAQIKKKTSLWKRFSQW